MSIPDYKASAQPHLELIPQPHPLAWVPWDDERAPVDLVSQIVTRAVVLVSRVLISKQALGSPYLHLGQSS